MNTNSFPNFPGDGAIRRPFFLDAMDSCLVASPFSDL
jgi:hypothetical protein